MIGPAGFEPAQNVYKTNIVQLNHGPKLAAAGIEPTSFEYESNILPLNYAAKMFLVRLELTKIWILSPTLYNFAIETTDYGGGRTLNFGFANQ